jgi:hypothetical protein
MWSDPDEIPLQKAMPWIIHNPPRHFYRFLGSMFFYSYRHQCRADWRWPYIMKYGAKKRKPNWFKDRTPDHPPFDYVFGAKEWRPETQSLYHCSYCFPSIGQIIAKPRSFSHEEFSSGKYIDPNYIYVYVYCSHSLFKGEYKLVDFDPVDLRVPHNDPRFDYLKMRLSFNDSHQHVFNFTLMKQYAPCELDFLANRTELPKELPNHLK